MPPAIHPEISGSSGSFSIFVAPSGILEEALSNLLSSNRKHALYLCGNYPEMLPKFSVNQRNLSIRRALTSYQILTILQEAYESLILFEHDRTWYEDNAELIPIIGEICKKKAEEFRTVILFSTTFDRWLSRIDPYGHRVVYFLNIESKLKKETPISGQTQHTLQGIW
ncbi:MAG TPA: hypothetical protein VN372_15305 [Methanospirillum sp.]|nr:hypothetical protein [Methanospirillum sp.]